MSKGEVVRSETSSLRANFVEISKRDALGDCRDTSGGHDALGRLTVCKFFTARRIGRTWRTELLAQRTWKKENSLLFLPSLQIDSVPSCSK